MVIEPKGSMIESESSEQSSGRTTFSGGGGILNSVEETGDGMNPLWMSRWVLI